MTDSTTLPPPLPELSLRPASYPVEHWVPQPDGTDAIDLDAPYQRGEVWGDDRRRNLIKSLLMRYAIGDLVVSQLPYDRDKFIRVVDGKQRITSVRLFHAGRLTIPGWWLHDITLKDPSARHRDITFHDLSDRGRRTLENTVMPSLEFDPQVEYTRGPDGKWIQRQRSEQEMLEAEAELYLLRNFGGVPQTEEDRQRAERVAGTGN